MRTFTDLVTAAEQYCGLTSNLSTNAAQDVTALKQDINNGIKMFRHGARVAFTQKTATTPTTDGQVEYLLPADCLRVTTVRGVLPNGVAWQVPMQEVISEEEWLRLTMVPYSTATNPLFYYIKGNDTLCVYPSPSGMSGSNLIVNYEPKMPNLYLDDITSTNNSYTNDSANNTNGKPTPVTANLINNGATVVLSQPIITVPNNSLYFEVTDGSDGNCYRIASIPDVKTLVLRQNYQLPGISDTTAQFRIGQSMDFPEEFQLAPAYYAAAQYYYKRKDNGQAGMYDGMFQQLVSLYKENYGKKTTRRTQIPANFGGYSPFFMTPGAVPNE